MWFWSMTVSERVYLRDVATTQEGLRKTHLRRSEPMANRVLLSVSVKKKVPMSSTWSQRAHETIDELNAGLLADNGLLTFDWVYDQTPYINTAISIR